VTFASAAVPGGRHGGAAGLRSGAWGVAVAWVAAGRIWLRANFAISGGYMVALHSDIRGRDCSTTWCVDTVLVAACPMLLLTNTVSGRRSFHKQSPEFCIECHTATILAGRAQFIGRVSSNTIRRDSLPLPQSLFMSIALRSDCITIIVVHHLIC